MEDLKKKLKRKKQMFVHKCLRCKRSFPSKLTYTLHLERKHLKYKRNIENVNLVKQQQSELIDLCESNYENCSYFPPESETRIKNEIIPEDEVCYYSDDTAVPEEPLLECNTNLADCDFCTKRFEIHLLKNHIITKHKFTTCCLCNKSIFSKEHDFIPAMEFNKQNYKCCGCFQKFSSVAKFRNHLITHLYCNFYICIICKKRFKSEELFQEHLTHHTEISFICNICSIMFKQIVLFQKHASEEHVGTKYYATMLSSVQQLHKKFLKISCELCEKEFKHVQQLCTHILTEHSDPTKNNKKNLIFPCESCNLQFEQECDLQKHVSLIHVEKTKEIPCHICNVLFERECLLRDHILATHLNKKFEHVCGSCKNQYENKADLEKHILDTHMNEMTIFFCQHCSTVFESKKIYQAHLSEIRKNAVMRYRTCKLCGKYFKRKAYLRDHIMRVHDEPLKIICDICNKQFQNKISFNAHIAKEHEELMKFICQHCNKRFHYKGYLQLHIARRHTNKPKQSCKFCAKIFKNKYEVNCHILKFH